GAGPDRGGTDRRGVGVPPGRDPRGRLPGDRGGAAGHPGRVRRLGALPRPALPGRRPEGRAPPQAEQAHAARDQLL
ncbi:MAG: FIG00996855: hypothetical protein, partial [uncultured Pseudonocardia sp.]